MQRLYTTRELAEHFGCSTDRIRRLFGRYLPEPARVGGNRIVPESDLSAIKSALIRSGYLPPENRPAGEAAPAAGGAA